MISERDHAAHMGEMDAMTLIDTFDVVSAREWDQRAIAMWLQACEDADLDATDRELRQVYLEAAIGACRRLSDAQQKGGA